MGDTEAIERRIAAIERALTDEEQDLTALEDAAALATTVDRLADRLDELEAQVTELEAATQAVRGYVGNVRSVNQEVERTAEAALAKAEDLESRMTGARRSERPHDTATGSRGALGDGDAAAVGPVDRDPPGRSPGVATGRRAHDREPPNNGHDRHTGDPAPDSQSGRGRSRAFADRAREGEQTAHREEGTDDGGFLAGLRDSL